jgi:hypothetical protein
MCSIASQIRLGPTPPSPFFLSARSRQWWARVRVSPPRPPPPFPASADAILRDRRPYRPDALHSRPLPRPRRSSASSRPSFEAPPSLSSSRSGRPCPPPAQAVPVLLKVTAVLGGRRQARPVPVHVSVGRGAGILVLVQLVPPSSPRPGRR